MTELSAAGCVVVAAPRCCSAMCLRGARAAAHERPARAARESHSPPVQAAPACVRPALCWDAAATTTSAAAAARFSGVLADKERVGRPLSLRHGREGEREETTTSGVRARCKARDAGVYVYRWCARVRVKGTGRGEPPPEVPECGWLSERNTAVGRAQREREREKGSEWEEEEGCACNVQVRRADVGLAVFVASARPAAPFSLSLSLPQKAMRPKESEREGEADG